MSIQLAHMSGQVFDFKDGAGEGNRTLVISLEGGISYPEPPQRHKGGAEQTARVRAILAGTTARSKATSLFGEILRGGFSD